MRKHGNRKQAVYFCVILILVLVVLFSGLRILESTVFYQEEPAPPTRTITRDGVDYFPRQDITVLMVLGIDAFGPVEDSGSYRNSGAADVVMLMIFDEAEARVNVLCLNRDTMLEMSVLGIGGKRAGSRFGQLALAHTYGSGLEDSCENTAEAVSGLLYGIPIDHYISLNMDAITLLNDAVGGVPVTVQDDFSHIDPTITMGEMTLRGQQALHFVRSREGLGDQLNVSRMERQREYIHGFLDAFRAKSGQSEGFVLSVYEEISPYLVTDCSVNGITGMMERYGNYTVGEILSLPGENVLGETYYEFYADEEAMDDLILRLFYGPKE